MHSTTPSIFNNKACVLDTVLRWCTSARCEIALQIRHSTLALDLLDESSLARLAEGRVVSRNNLSFAHKEHQGAKDLHLFWAKEVEIRGRGFARQESTD